MLSGRFSIAGGLEGACSRGQRIIYGGNVKGAGGASSQDLGGGVVAGLGPSGQWTLRRSGRVQSAGGGGLE